MSAAARPSRAARTNPRPCLACFYNLRLGVSEDVQVEARNRHETGIRRDDDQSPQALTHQRKTLFLVVRAFIDARFRDQTLSDPKALRRQPRRQAKRPEQPDGTDRPRLGRAPVPLYRQG